MTFEEYDAMLLESIDVLVDLHAVQECLEDCFLCQAENLIFEAPLETIVDDLLESHKGHRKMWGYPFVDTCQYCGEENYFMTSPEFKLLEGYER